MQKRIVADGHYNRIDSYIASFLGVSRSHIKTIADKQGITVNGKIAKAKTSVEAGDVVEITIDEPTPIAVKPVDIPIEIIYEDDDIAVVNKPQGLTVHAGNGTGDNTLVNALLYRLDSLSGINGVIRPGIVHRIDKDTSGLLVVAKNDKAHVGLSAQIEKKTCHRNYLALLDGNLKTDSGRIDTFIARSDKDRTAFAVSDKGRRAITDYNVVERYEGGYTLCEFSLLTGRTHQIRVHCKHLNCPIVGDKVYGRKKCKFELNGQLLHAYKLSFTHPVSGEKMTFTCPLPDYFEGVLKSLKKI